MLLHVISQDHHTSRGRKFKGKQKRSSILEKSEYLLNLYGKHLNSIKSVKAFSLLAVWLYVILRCCMKLTRVIISIEVGSLSKNKQYSYLKISGQGRNSVKLVKTFSLFLMFRIPTFFNNFSGMSLIL